MTGNFFAIDRRRWAQITALGINPATAYLVLACGSGRDQRTTSWSCHAVETYTGISRTRAKTAVQALVAAEAVRVTSNKASHPQYEILP
jgi:hypothetical protein